MIKFFSNAVPSVMETLLNSKFACHWTQGKVVPKHPCFLHEYEIASLDETFALCKAEPVLNPRRQQQLIREGQVLTLTDIETLLAEARGEEVAVDLGIL